MRVTSPPEVSQGLECVRPVLGGAVSDLSTGACTHPWLAGTQVLTQEIVLSFRELGISRALIGSL